MKNKPIPEIVREFYDYDGITLTSKTGKFLTQNNEGYQVCQFPIEGKQRRFLAHRVAWFIFYNEDPSDKIIDHKNGNKTDNSIENLRIVINQTNIQNVRNAQKNNKTGILGVTKRNNIYMATIGYQGKTYFLGSYDFCDDAETAYLEAKEELHNGMIPSRYVKKGLSSNRRKPAVVRNYVFVKANTKRPWRSQMIINGVSFLDHHETEEEAIARVIELRTIRDAERG